MTFVTLLIGVAVGAVLVIGALGVAIWSDARRFDPDDGGFGGD